jgi:hypothetical protein
MFQCAARGIPLGPIAPFNTWKKLGRHVRKGERAIELCMPIQRRRFVETTDDAGTLTTEAATWTQFVYKRHWFTLAQTNGQPFEPPAPPTWDKARALRALDIVEIPFDLLDGNCQGFARGRSIAVNPVAGNPFKTLAHELAHVVIGHTAEAELRDDERTPRNLRELEAEATAMLVCAALNMPGVEESRAYCQHCSARGILCRKPAPARFSKPPTKFLRPADRSRPPMAQKALWTIRTTARLTAELWQQFVDKTREAGSSPVRALEDFILRYIEKGPDHDDSKQR